MIVLLYTSEAEKKIELFGGSLSQLYDGDLNLNLEILTSISVDFELSPKKTLVSLVS